jgi:hypothetical protein
MRIADRCMRGLVSDALRMLLLQQQSAVFGIAAARQSNPGSMMASKSTSQSVLAWQGWETRIPTHWRPLQIIEEKGRRGSVMIGDARQAVVLVKWWRPEDARFDADRWIRLRLRALNRHARPDADAPRSEDFDWSAWVRGAAIGKGGGEKTVWYGYARRAGLVLELVVNGAVARRLQEIVWRRVIPGLTAAAPGQPTHWSLYDVGFEAPPDFTLRQRRLQSGDIALEFGRARERLLLRQIYPATLALTRRPIARWMAVYPFSEHRRFALHHEEAWGPDEAQDRSGVRRAGRKRFPFPLGPLRPFVSDTVAWVDPHLDRLLLAEHLAPTAEHGKLAAWAVTRMNRQNHAGAMGAYRKERGRS